MSKTKLLLDVVEDMRRLADSLRVVADSIQGNTPTEESHTVLVSQQPPQKHTVPAVSIDQVRAVLAEKSGDGKTAEVKSLLYKYDAGKLSSVKPEDYVALMEEARKL